MASGVFCDRLTVTCPKGHDAALRDVCQEFAVRLDAYPEGVPGRWLLGGGGTFYYQARGRFASLEASGRALVALRQSAYLADYLMALGSLPHRVTRLDATLDIPRRAAPFLHDVYALGKSGRVYLSQKPVCGTEVSKWLGPALYPDEPLDTGTVYIPMRRYGSKRQYLTVYDKRQERLARGYADPGHLLRVEVSAARDKLATLSDAWDPTALFYDVAAPSVLPKPPSAPGWVPGAGGWSGEGYAPASPPTRLRRLLEGPLGVELLRAADYPGGLADIRHWLGTVEKGHILGGGSPVVTVGVH